MFSGSRQAADGGIQSRAGSYPDLASTTSSAHALFTESSRLTGVATAAERALVAVPADGHVTVDGRRDLLTRPGRINRHRIGLASIDLSAALVAAIVAYSEHFGGPPWEMLVHHSLVLVLPAAWLILLALNCGSGERDIGTWQQECGGIFRAFLHLTVLVAIASYAIHTDLARGFLLIALPLALVLNFGGRLAARAWLSRHTAGAVLAVGETAAVSSFAEAVKQDRSARFVLRGACLLDDEIGDVGTLSSIGVPTVRDIDSVVESARAMGAATIVVVSASRLGSDRLRWIAWQLEGTGMDLIVSPGLVEVAHRRLRVRSVAWMPLLSVDQPEYRGLRRMLKEVMDRVIALLAVVMLLPLFAVIFAAVRLSTPGPAIFRQTRVGRDGRTFRMLKFRSMFVDAESRLAELKSENVHLAGPLFKLHRDPRVTPIGRILRRWSLDELPQLFNVLAGRMSLVGPRPGLPEEVLQYETHARRRLLVKPGITGLWQVSGRSDLTWRESVQLDLRYVENWSPALDLMILWKTASAVLRRSGAY